MADTSKRLAGVAYLSVDGQTYLLTGDLSYSPSKVKRETLVGQDGVHGYSEMPLAGFIAGTFRDTGGIKVSDFNKMTNVTVTAELANGKTVVGRNMWQAGDALEVKTQESTVEVRWESTDVSEQ